MDSPFQPLPDKFIPQTLIAFLRFCLLHPLLTVLSCILTLAPKVLAPLAPAFITITYNGILLIPFHMFITALLGSAAFGYLSTNKNQDSPRTALNTANTFISFVREHYHNPESPFRWHSTVPKFLKFCLPFFALIGILSPTPAEPATLAYPLNDILLDGLLFIPILGLGWAAIFCPIQITQTHLYQWKKTGAYILCAMLFPILKDPDLTAKSQGEILRLNSAQKLSTLFALWTLIRIPLSFIGANAIVDAFAFAALVHASLGGTLSPSKATQTQYAPSNAQPQPSL